MKNMDFLRRCKQRELCRNVNDAAPQYVGVSPKIVGASSSRSLTVCPRRTKSVFSTAYAKIDDIISTHFNAELQLGLC